MHIECPKNDQFGMPLSWMTQLTDENGSMREVSGDQQPLPYENVTIVNKPNYMVCCGASKGQGPEN